MNLSKEFEKNRLKEIDMFTSISMVGIKSLKFIHIFLILSYLRVSYIVYELFTIDNDNNYDHNRKSLSQSQTTGPTSRRHVRTE